MTLTAPGGKIPKDLSWAAGKKFMGNVDAFLKSLLNFDKDNIPVNCVDACEKEYISNPNFTPDNIRSKSSAAAGLCGWVVNICKYFRIYQVSFQENRAPTLPLVLQMLGVETESATASTAADLPPAILIMMLTHPPTHSFV